MMIAKKFGKNICSIKVHHSSHGLMEIGWEVFTSDRISSLEWKWILKYFHSFASVNSYVRWDDRTPACFLIKCNFDIGTQQPTLTFPARAACLSVSQKSVVDMWQCLRLLTVNPALPHCVTALAGLITTFKLHTTVDSYGSHGGIVCLYLSMMKILFWIFLCSFFTISF